MILLLASNYKPLVVINDRGTTMTCPTDETLNINLYAGSANNDEIAGQNGSDIFISSAGSNASVGGTGGMVESSFSENNFSILHP